MGFGGSNVGDASTQLYNQQQAAIDKGLKQLNQTFSGFTPGFYNQRQQDYINYAMPQLQQQFQQNQQGLNFGLGQQGLLKSSAAQNMNAQLKGQYNLGQQNIANVGQQQAQALQQQVANSQAQLTSQLTNSANPSSVSQQALNAAASYSAPSTFAPVGNLFSQWGNIYAANALSQPQTGGTSPYYGFNNRSSGGYNIPTAISG